MSTAAIRVLLVEDSVSDARRIREALSGHPCGAPDIVTLDRLAPALDALDHGGFDVLLLDLGLPDSHGLATFLEAQKHARGLPVVVLSDYSDDMVAVEAIRRGARGGIAKPEVSASLLLRAIGDALERTKS